MSLEAAETRTSLPRRDVILGHDCDTKRLRRYNIESGVEPYPVFRAPTLKQVELARHR